MNRFEKTSNDLTALAPKWSERGHLLAALPKHLADAQEAIKSQQNIDKEMTDLSLIASAWLKSQQQKELLEARLKRFKETAGYPSMASVLASPAVVGNTNKEHAMNNLNKAAEFGAMMGKMAALDPAVANALGLGAVGLVGGGLAGGLLGYENPGDLLDSNSKPQVEFDETGKTPIYNSDGTFKTKKKSRLRAGIEGAMGGGFIGGLGGAAVGGGGTELMRVSPKIQNWLTGRQVSSGTKIPIDAVNDLKDNLISRDVSYANRKYDQLGRDKHFDFMRNGIPKDTASQATVFGRKVGPVFYSGPDWKINLNKGQPTPVDELFSQFGPTVVDNPLSRGANSAHDWVSGLFNKK